MQQEVFLESLSFLDVQKGLAYCGGSPEFYKEMLETFTEHSSLQRLMDAYAREDLDSYRIDIHALKSASLTIGAAEFSEECKKLEYAARDRDLQYIRDWNQKVLGQYQQLLTAISHALDKENQQEDSLIRPSSQSLPGPSPDILIVDDDLINQRLAQRILEKDMTIA